MSYHFVTGDFRPQKVFLPDKEYGLALDALVKGCADVLLTRGEGASLRILLGKRKVEPQPDWWFVGGRTRPGDTPAGLRALPGARPSHGQDLVERDGALPAAIAAAAPQPRHPRV